MDELKSARVLYENELYFKSIVSAYYAVYHAAKAALLLYFLDFQNSIDAEYSSVIS
ncbi:MAG: HEPN domain-containing protein [Thermodesulfovibrionales bacterium]